MDPLASTPVQVCRPPPPNVVSDPTGLCPALVCFGLAGLVDLGGVGGYSLWPLSMYAIFKKDCKKLLLPHYPKVHFLANESTESSCLSRCCRPRKYVSFAAVGITVMYRNNNQTRGNVYVLFLFLFHRDLVFFPLFFPSSCMAVYGLSPRPVSHLPLFITGQGTSEPCV